MHASKPRNHAYGAVQARTQALTKNEKNEIEGTTSNDTESIQIATRDYQKLNFFQNSRFSYIRKPLAGVSYFTVQRTIPYFDEDKRSDIVLLNFDFSKFRIFKSSQTVGGRFLLYDPAHHSCLQ